MTGQAAILDLMRLNFLSLLGKLYVMGLDGKVFRIASAVPQPGTSALLAGRLLVVRAVAICSMLCRLFLQSNPIFRTFR